jgi:hypothetical protein
MMNWNWQRKFALLALIVGVFMLAADFAEARRGGGGAAGISRSGPAASGSVRGNRGDARRDVRDDRRDFRRDRYDDRRDFREDVYRDRRRVRAARAISASAFRNLSCRSEIIVVGNVTYYRCGGGWYQRAYHGGSVTYVIVTAPAGY